MLIGDIADDFLQDVRSEEHTSELQSRNRITALRIVAVPRDAEVEEKKPKRAGTAF